MALQPIIFIPGFPASELVDASTGKTLFPPIWWQTLPLIGSKKKLIQRLITDQTGVVAGDPILSVAGLAKQAASLYASLKSLGYDTSSASTPNFRAVGWDWRKGVDGSVTQTAIAKAIDAFGQNVVMIVHSTGGLVFRAFVEKNPSYAAKIDRVIAFAVPWVGTLDAFEALTIGVSEKFIGVIGFGAGEVRQISSTCQAAYDLCPPDPAETDMTAADGSPIALFVKVPSGVAAGPLVAPAEWTSDPAMQMLASNARTRFGARARSITSAPPIVNICGWGLATIDRCTLTSGKLAFSASAEKSGDTTVPFVSSSWLTEDGNRVKAFHVPIGAYERSAVPDPHPRIWDSPPVVELLKSFLGLAPPGPFLAAAVDNDDNFPSVDPVRIRVSAADANGVALPAARVTLRLPPTNPSFNLGPGQRRLEIKLGRQGLPNNANGNARIEVDLDWNGGSAKTAIAIRVT